MIYIEGNDGRTVTPVSSIFKIELPEVFTGILF